MVMLAARRLVAALWAGSLWAVGYLAAPTVFSSVTSTLAGDVVGKLLRNEAWVSIGCALALLVLLRVGPELDARHRKVLDVVVLAMLACTLAVYLGVQPLMAQMREAAGPAGMRASPQWTQFAILHGVSQLVYLVESLLGAVLVLKVR
jgi:hypothetical protein